MSLLVIKRHKFHGSKSEKYLFQRFWASTKCTPFPLLYPEGAMFPSIVWSTANDNYSITGSIPLLILLGYFKEDSFADITTSIVWSTANDNYSITGSIPLLILLGYFKEDSFADITTHVLSILINASSSTSSDYRYTMFGHELMCSIATNHFDMRQHRKGTTSSNNAAGGLDLRCKDDSSFLHSIDIHQMV